MLIKQASQKHTLNHCFRKHNKTLCFRRGPIVVNSPSKLCSDHGGDDKDLPVDGNLTAEGCPTSIVVLQVFAPTTSLHFLLGPWCWICFFLPTRPWSGLLVAAEPLVSFSTGVMSLWIHLWLTPRSSHQHDWPLVSWERTIEDICVANWPKSSTKRIVLISLQEFGWLIYRFILLVGGCLACGLAY